MAFSAAVAFRLSWRSGPELHTNLGLIAVVLALAMGLGGLVRFHARRNVKFLFIGAGFLGTAALDALHTAIGTGRLPGFVPIPPQDVLAVSWHTSQIFLGAMLLLGSGVAGPERGEAINPSRLNWRLGMAALMLVCCFTYALAPPDAQVTTSLFAGRALGAGATVVLLCALWTLISKRDWTNDRFEYWLVAALLLACGSQLLFLTQRGPLFGAMLDIAHALKIGAYSLALTGMLSNGYQLFIQTDRQVEALAQLNSMLRKEIAHREAAEAALRVSEERFSLALEGCDEGLWDWPDMSLPAQWWSPRFYTLLGYEPGEIEPTNTAFLRRVLDPDDYERTRAAVKAHLEGGEAYDIEYRLRTKPGERRWFRSRAKTFRSGNPGRVRMAGTIIDIHSRKLAEATVKQQAEELAAVNEELEQFAYAASHDLQEPLRNLIAYCDLLRQDVGPNPSEDASSDLHYIEDAAKRMKALIEDLLALSRAGRTALGAAPVNVEECVRKSLANLRQQVLESDARIHWDELPTVPGDPTMLTQLYQNLIGNALKFRGGYPPEIELTAEARNGHWILGVHDNGIGLDQQYAERIFSPFQRLHGMAEYAGNGIGLAICRKTVERHGGRIWVESEPGRGSHFKFTLPSRSAEPEPAFSKEADEPLSRYA